MKIKIKKILKKIKTAKNSHLILRVKRENSKKNIDLYGGIKFYKNNVCPAFFYRCFAAYKILYRSDKTYKKTAAGAAVCFLFV